jgi:hypothetical protein
MTEKEIEPDKRSVVGQSPIKAEPMDLDCPNRISHHSASDEAKETPEQYLKSVRRLFKTAVSMGGVTLLVAIAMFFVTCAQWKAMRDQNSIMIEQNKVMIGQNTLLAEQFSNENRAWIGDGRAGHSPLVSGKPVRCKLEIVNFGKSPASNVVIHATCGFAPMNQDISALTFPDLPKEKRDTIYPSGTRQIVIDSPVLSESDIQVIKDKAWTLYVKCSITYEDPFSKDRETGFCSYYDVQLDSLRPYADGNYAK